MENRSRREHRRSLCPHGPNRVDRLRPGDRVPRRGVELEHRWRAPLLGLRQRIGYVGAIWSLSTIVSTNQVGVWPSLAFGSDGRGFVSYTDVTNQDIRWAHTG